MKYEVGDIVRFKLKSGEVQEGDVQYVERNIDEKIYYINSFKRWAYKVPENRVISHVLAKRRFRVV